MKRRTLFVLALAPLTRAKAQFPGIDATEATQLWNHAELVTQIAKQIEHIQIALNTYNQIMIAGRLLSNMQWTNAMQDLTNMAGIVQMGQGLAYSMAQLDQSFADKYPGFAATTQPYFKQYQKWSQSSLDTIRGTLRGSALQYQQLQSEQLYTLYLQQQNNSAVGQMQAIQSGNQISVEMLKSIGKLRQLMLADMQSKQAYQAYNVQKEMRTQDYEQTFFAPSRAGRDGVGW